MPQSPHLWPSVKEIPAFTQIGRIFYHKPHALFYFLLYSRFRYKNASYKKKEARKMCYHTGGTSKMLPY